MSKRSADRPLIRFIKAPARLAAAMAAAWGLLAIAGPVGAAAGEHAKPQQQAERPSGTAPPAPGELAREGLAKMLQALDAMVQAVPQYHMPEITENGDIILRRKSPQPAPAPTPPRRQTPPEGTGPGTPI